MQVGITGGIGAGKSLVCRILATLGVPVYDADNRAKWLMANDTSLKKQIKYTFGAASFLPDGTPNRPFLAEKVFNDPQQLQKINCLVHPKVAEDYAQWAAQTKAPYMLKEAALLFETGSHKSLDYNILVKAPVPLRIKRVLARDPHRNEEGVKAILAKQMPEPEKESLSDFTLVNDEQEMLLPQVIALHEKLKALASK